MKHMRNCPFDGCDLRHVGSLGVRGYGDYPEDAWDAQADRWDCPEGHSFLIVDTARLEPFDAEQNPEGR